MTNVTTDTYKALLIPVYGEWEYVDIEQDASLETLQHYVGGLIEVVRGIEEFDGCTAYCNEEGLIINLPLNVRASLLAGCKVHGSVVVCGFDPNKGENLDVPVREAEHMNQMVEDMFRYACLYLMMPEDKRAELEDPIYKNCYTVCYEYEKIGQAIAEANDDAAS